MIPRSSHNNARFKSPFKYGSSTLIDLAHEKNWDENEKALKLNGFKAFSWSEC